MELAVITIPVYKRIDHLKKCIESLKNNSLAKESILYIYSDSPAKNDIEAVLNLRRYIKNIKGFKQVIIKEQSENKNLQNIVESIEEPLQTHGKIIYLEEDLEVSTSFLEIMNKALDFYSEDDFIFSVSGYTLPCFSNENPLSFRSSYSFSAWGCGLWQSKYLHYKKYIEFRSISDRLNHNLIFRIKFIINHRLHQYLHYKEKSDINRLTPDLSIGFYIWDVNKVQIFPSRPIVGTNGFDGSGWHCGIDPKFNNQQIAEILHENIFFTKTFNIEEARFNFEKIKKFHNLNLLQDIKSLIKYLLKKFRF